MAEFSFVLKSFLFTCMVVFTLQFKVGDKTGDQRINEFLQSSRISGWMKDVGTGAVRVTASTYNAVTDKKLPNMPSLPNLQNVVKGIEEKKAAVMSNINNAEQTKARMEAQEKELMKKLEDIENQ